MSIYGDKKDYEELMKERLNKARVLIDLSNEDFKKVQLLLEKKEQIRIKNGFLATFQINHINKKIEKIRSKYKK